LRRDGPEAVPFSPGAAGPRNGISAAVAAKEPVQFLGGQGQILEDAHQSPAVLPHILDMSDHGDAGLAPLLGTHRIRYSPDSQCGPLDLTTMAKQRFDLRQHIEKLDVELFGRMSDCEVVGHVAGRKVSATLNPGDFPNRGAALE
jgi:hypothetical protein